MINLIVLRHSPMPPSRQILLWLIKIIQVLWLHIHSIIECNLQINWISLMMIVVSRCFMLLNGS